MDLRKGMTATELFRHFGLTGGVFTAPDGTEHSTDKLVFEGVVGAEGVAAMGRATLVGRIAEPEEIANTICAIADPLLFGYTTGQVFAANGGLYLD